MRKLHFILAVLMALAAAPYLAAQISQQSILPREFAGWTGQKQFDYAMAGPQPSRQAVAQETGESLVFFIYAKGSDQLRVFLRKYQDPSTAYEAYTADLTPEMQASDLGQYSAVDKDHMYLLTGNLILDVILPASITTKDLLALAHDVRIHADQTPLPPIRAYLPGENLLNGTQRYALGGAGYRNALKTLKRPEFELLENDIDFKIGAEAMLGQYRTGKSSAVLLLLEYPTPQLAEQHLKHLEKSLSNAANLAGTTIERKGSLLSLVLTPTSQAYAKKLRDSVNYETAVTWNEPSQTLTDPPWTSTIAKIFVGTGVFMVIALALGVAFGGVRVITKRLFPGKVFDRPQDIEILQLGLSGKKIDPTDMY